ncbi:MAG: SGNH/GDSL hydrolase family protein [Paracoccaceae bacterium]|nr:SGNH/GDSL hydrolase family protein [Paracoccaceae bacterium]
MPRILIYGDSNTFGTGPMGSLQADPVLPPGARWGDVLAGSLGEGWHVVIEGLPGRTTVFDDPVEGAYRNGLTVLPAILHSHRPIDLLVICLGTNDQKQRFGLGAQDIALGLARLTREALASGTVARVLLVAPPPVRERGDLAGIFQGAEVRCGGLAAEIARFAEVEGAAFFDAGSVISVDELDGVHWSAASHEDLGLALVDVVKGLA